MPPLDLSELRDTQKRSGSSADVARVSQETTALQKLIAEHREIANNVEQRLTAVLRPRGPAAETGNAQAAIVTSPLASDLAQFREDLADLANHYLDILNRLEV